MPNPACVTYEAYRAALKEFLGQDVPLWDELHEERKKVWWKTFLAATKITTANVDCDAECVWFAEKEDIP